MARKIPPPQRFAVACRVPVEWRVPIARAFAVERKNPARSDVEMLEAARSLGGNVGFSEDAMAARNEDGGKKRPAPFPAAGNDAGEDVKAFALTSITVRQAVSLVNSFNSDY